MTQPPLLVLLLLATTAAAAPTPKKAAPAKKAAASQAASRASPLAPVPAATVKWSHAPYEDGNCAICHERKDPKNPGRITMGVNELCYSCHEDFEQVMKSRPHTHSPARKSCTNCHNPHNATQRMLLLTDTSSLCLSCHEMIEGDLKTAKVVHKPVTEGAKCLSCHNPHASNVQQLLVRQPFDLCLNCHKGSGMKDAKGVALTDMKQLLEKNKSHHGPVEAKDCTACHMPHSSDSFRLLVDTYPAEFYAPYDPDNYALCFECHKSEMVRDPQTTTLTKFRDGSRNLHYLHVNQPERGRTCRACHEVHAASQPHVIRDAVPYGSRGWMLQINFTPNPNGGTCAKTCHSTKTYVNRGADAAAKQR